MPNTIALYGAGGHGKSVLDALLCAKDRTVVGFLDDNKTGEHMGMPILGNAHDLPDIRKRGIDEVFVCIGNGIDRAAVTDMLHRSGISLATVVHPSATVAASASLSPGCLVLAQTSIGPDAHIGTGCIVNTGATVDHDCVLEAYVHLAPGVHLAGNIRIGTHTHIGIGSCVKEGICIGDNVTVGAGSVVLHDLPSDCTAYGCPAAPR